MRLVVIFATGIQRSEYWEGAIYHLIDIAVGQCLSGVFALLAKLRPKDVDTLPPQ